MAAPNRKLYIGVLVAFLLFIPAGLLLHHYGPAMVEAWRFRKLGGPMEARGRFAGCVVSGDYGGENLLIDVSGKVLRRWPTPEGCSAAIALDNGNILFGAQGKVWEADRDGKEVWRLPESAALGWVTDVRRLANGNTLVAMRLTHRGTSFVLEFTPAGKEVWRRKSDDYPQSAQRLRSGNTLIGFWNIGAVEVTPDGKAVWKHEIADCASARRLSNGNTLIATSPAVVEIDPAGQVVWEHKCEWPRSIERLPDGRTLISSGPRLRSDPSPLIRVLLVSPDGKEEVLYKGPGSEASAVYE